MNMDDNATLYVVGFLILVGIIVFVCNYYSKKAVVKRKLKKAVDKKISSFVSGDIAKIVGKVEIVGEPIIAPLSGRKCAYYYILVEERVSTGKSSHWRTIIEEEVSGSFLVRDGRYCAHINTQKVKSYIVQDRLYTSGFMEDATAVLERYLKVHGQESEGFLGFNKTLRYKEGVLEHGEIIAALGRGEWKNANSDQISENSRILEINSTEEAPVFLSDDPDTVRSIYF